MVFAGVPQTEKGSSNPMVTERSPVILNGVAREVHLEPNSSEWYAWRERGIGASEVPAIMGESRYQSAKSVWEVKTNRAKPFAGNHYTRSGQYHEPYARQEYGKLYEPVVPHCYESLLVPYMRASLDGINFDGTCIVEIKCPLTQTVPHEAKAGRVAKHYYGQLQAQLFVTGARLAHFFVWFSSNGYLVEVQRNDEYISRMLERAAWFWSAVQANVWPEDATATAPAEPCDVLDMSENDEWARAAAGYRDAIQRLKAAEAEVTPLEATLKRLAIRTARGAGVEVRKGKRAGAIDYKKIPAVLALTSDELEEYRKAEVPITEIKVL